jgi:K+-sensing histidine kinase KdpD
MIFVLGVFLVSRKTQGFFYGITASLISVLAVNYAFTYPYYAFDLITPECLSSAVVMLIVAIMTGTLTTAIKQQEKQLLNLAKSYRNDGNAVAVACVHSVSVAVQEHKTFNDYSGNNINHPNDWFYRVYAQTLLQTLIGYENMN